MKYIYSFIIVLFVLTSCETKNKKDYSNWKNETDSVFGFSVMIPDTLNANYFKFWYVNSIYTNKKEQRIWDIVRIPKPMYHFDSNIKGNINVKDSESVEINGTICKLYKFRYPSKKEYDNSITVEYKTKYFVFEISTVIDNDLRFEQFYKSFKPDTFLLKKQFESFKTQGYLDTTRKINYLYFSTKLKKGVESKMNFNIIQQYDTTNNMINIAADGCGYKWVDGKGWFIKPTNDTIKLKIYLIESYFHFWKIQIDTIIKI